MTIPFRPGSKRTRLAIAGNTSASKTLLERSLLVHMRVTAAMTGHDPDTVSLADYNKAKRGRSGT